jgi:hypothetical protein
MITPLKHRKISKHTRHFDVIVVEDKPQGKELVYVEGVSKHKVDSRSIRKLRLTSYDICGHQRQAEHHCW